MVAKLTKLSVFLSLLAVGIPFTVYVLTASRSIYGVDSGDFLSAAWVFGVAHSPGYPLYTLLLALWARIPLGLDPIFQMNLTSAIFHSLTVGVVSLILYKLTKSYLISLATCLMLAFSYLFWTYSLVVEAFALNDLLAALLILVILYWYESVQKKQFKSAEKLLLLFLFLFSLSFTHHQTIVLLLPAFLYLFFASGFHKKITKLLVAKGLVASFLGLLPYLYLPIAASFNPPINWKNPTTLGRFLGMLFRTEFGTFSASINQPQHLGFARIVQLGWYLGFLKADFSYLGIAIAILGALFFYVVNKRLFWFFSLGLLISGPFFLFYANFPTNKAFTLEVAQRFVLFSYLFFVVFLIYGFLALKLILSKFLSLLLKNQKLLLYTSYFIILTSALCISLFAFLSNYPKVDLSQKFIGGNLASDVLATSDVSATLSLEDDTFYFNSIALKTVEGQGYNIQLLMGGALRQPDTELFRKKYPNLVFPPEEKNSDKPYFLSLLEANPDKFAIYTIEGGGLEVKGGVWVPVGILTRLYPEDKRPSDEEFDRLQEVWKTYKNNTDDFAHTSGNLTFEHIAGLYAAGHARAAKEYFDRKNLEKAKGHILEAIKINPSFSFIHFVYAKILETQGQCQEAISEFAKAYELQQNFFDNFLDRAQVARDCLKDEKLAGEYLKEYDQLLQQAQHSI